MRYLLAIVIVSLSLLFTSCKETTTGPQTGYGPAPPDFYLKQNYPNPFTDSTTIDYGVPYTGGSNSKVTIVIYDRFQQEVRIVVSNSSHPPGVFKTKWDGRNSKGIVVPKGIYIIEMRGYTPQATIKQVVAVKN